MEWRVRVCIGWVYSVIRALESKTFLRPLLVFVPFLRVCASASSAYRAGGLVLDDLNYELLRTVVRAVPEALERCGGLDLLQGQHGRHRGPAIGRS